MFLRRFRIVSDLCSVFIFIHTRVHPVRLLELITLAHVSLVVIGIRISFLIAAPESPLTFVVLYSLFCETALNIVELPHPSAPPYIICLGLSRT
jgi:hypothetical protein